MTDASSVPPGWYLDGQEARRRFWDGAQWTDQYQERESGSKTIGSKLRGFIGAQKDKYKGLPSDHLDAILSAEIARWEAKGWKLEGTTRLFGRSAMMLEPRWQAFFRDLLLVIVTLGVWLIYMLYRKLIGRTTSLVIRVNRYGAVKSFRYRDDLYGADDGSWDLQTAAGGSAATT